MQKNSGDILKNVIIYKVQKSFMLMLELIRFDNHQVYIKNIYLNGYVIFFVIVLCKEFTSPK